MVFRFGVNNWGFKEIENKKPSKNWDKIVLDHKKARDFQLWNFSFLILSRSLIVF
ncbi:Uncharacterised protein [Streptococcus pneumoniae]|nr:Uncharacterised protein [Streptococcus pneumoniae]